MSIEIGYGGVILDRSRARYNIRIAQWNGQFTGNTHRIKAADDELVLEHAVGGFNTCSEEMKPHKAKAIRKLAAKVMNARLKMIRAKLEEAMPVESHKWEAARTQVEHLKAAEAKLVSEGADGILREFGASELTEKT